MKCGGKEWEGKECVKQGCGEKKQEREKRSQRPTYKWRSKKKKSVAKRRYCSKRERKIRKPR